MCRKVMLITRTLRRLLHLVMDMIYVFCPTYFGLSGTKPYLLTLYKFSARVLMDTFHVMDMIYIFGLSDLVFKEQNLFRWPFHKISSWVAFGNCLTWRNFNGVDYKTHQGLRNSVAELLIMFLVFVPILLPISFLKMTLPVAMQYIGERVLA